MLVDLKIFDLNTSPQVSISSTFLRTNFCTNVVSAAFSCYVLALAKNSYKKRARKTLMKLTAGLKFPAPISSIFINIPPTSIFTARTRGVPRNAGSYLARHDSSESDREKHVTLFSLVFSNIISSLSVQNSLIDSLTTFHPKLKTII